MGPLNLPRILATLAAVGLVGCAGVTVRRVPRDGGDEILGFRYYLPRPHLAVKAPFPVAGGDFLVRGKLVEDRVELEGSALAELKSVGINLASMPLDQLRVRARRDSGGSLVRHGDTKEDEGNEKSETTPDADAKKVTVESSGEPLVRVAELYDIVYLPDLDQQYAIDVSAGMGAASTQFAFEHGWMLKSVALDIDNSQVGKTLAETVSKLVSTATTVALQATAPGTTAAKVIEALVKQGKERPKTVLVRVRYAVEALPGVYPFLNREEAKDLSPKPGVYMPIWPVTRVAFNVRTTTVLEVVDLRMPQANGQEESRGTGLSSSDMEKVTKAAESTEKGEGKKILGASYNPKSRTLILHVVPGSSLLKLDDSHRTSFLKAVGTLEVGTPEKLEVRLPPDQAP